MNIKKVSTIVAGTVLATALALSFSGCAKSGSGLKSAESLSIADYAVDFSKHKNYKQHSYDEVSLNYTYGALKDQICSTYNNFPLVYTDEGTIYAHRYKVVNFLNNKVIVSNLALMPSDFYVSGNNNGLHVLRTLEDNGDTTYTYSFYAMDGTLLMSSLYSTVTANLQSFYLDGVKTDILVVSSPNGENRYFKQTKDEITNEISYSRVDYSSLSVTANNSYIGNLYSPFLTKLYPDDSEKPVSSYISQYSVKSFGDEYTFYNGTVECGKLDMTYGTALTVMDRYFYYYTMKPVKPDAKTGYNLVIMIDGVPNKFDYSLHCYDVSFQKKTDIKCNAVIMGATSIYNYKEKSYDAALISGYIKENGVALVNVAAEFATTNEVAYVVNKDFKVAYDVPYMAGKSFDGNIYKISQLGYLLDDYIVDDNFKFLTMADTTAIYEKEGLISVHDSNGGYFFTDFSGLITSKTGLYPSKTSSYGEFEFYDGFALAYIENYDGDREPFLIENKETGHAGSLKNLSDLTYFYANSTKEIVYAGKGVYVMQTTNYSYSNYEDAESYRYEVFTYGGKLLKEVTLTVDEYDAGYFAIQEINGKLCIIETVGSSTRAIVNYYLVY